MWQLSLVYSRLATGTMLQDITWLAIQCFADCLKRREANRLGFACFEYRKVSQGNADFVGQLRQTHFSLS